MITADVSNAVPHVGEVFTYTVRFDGTGDVGALVPPSAPPEQLLIMPIATGDPHMRRFLMVPRLSGEIVIRPAALATAEISDADYNPMAHIYGGAKPVPENIKAESATPISIAAAEPPEDCQPWLPASGVALQSHVDGNAITLQATAFDALIHFMPDFALPEGALPVSDYASDKVINTGFMAVKSVTFKMPDNSVVPPVSWTWWNIETKRCETATLEGIYIPSAPKPFSLTLAWSAGLAVLLCAALAAARLSTKRSRLRRLCASNNLEAIRRHVIGLDVRQVDKDLLLSALQLAELSEDFSGRKFYERYKTLLEPPKLRKRISDLYPF